MPELVLAITGGEWQETTLWHMYERAKEKVGWQAREGRRPRLIDARERRE